MLINFRERGRERDRKRESERDFNRLPPEHAPT